MVWRRKYWSPDEKQLVPDMKVLVVPVDMQIYRAGTAARRIENTFQQNKS